MNDTATLERPAADGLVVEGLRVQFGGLVAVDNLTLEAPIGRITGLIGPNGAGKSTTFDSCSGFNQPTTGRISFCGHELIGHSAAIRAHVGIGRTFQRIELFDSLTVRTNVAMGREGRMAGRSPLTQLWAKRKELAEVAEATEEALELCGLLDIADVRAGALSTGQRRLVELARVLCGGHKLLLLDEPSSGLDPHESKEFGRLLRLAVERWGAGILVVEHDMALIAAVCDYIYVLDFGKLIFQGTPDQVLSSDVVRIAYLGTEAIPEVDE